MKAIFLSDKDFKVRYVYNGKALEIISTLIELDKTIYSSADLKTKDLTDTTIIFSTWGMPELTKEEITNYFPNLKALFYGAASVQKFARPFLELGIKVFSAWHADAVAVAEYTVSTILLAAKGFFNLLDRTKADFRTAKEYLDNYPGLYNSKIGILGYGAIGSLVIEMLKPYKVQIYLSSTSVTKEKAEELGITLCPMEEIFKICDVVSNHIADNENTVGIITKDYLLSMKNFSSFINTGRGRQVCEDGLVEKLESDESFTAILDVTYPEPLPRDSKLLQLRNCFLTPHMAGSQKNEVQRLGDYIAEEFARYMQDKPLKYEVKKEMLNKMA